MNARTLRSLVEQLIAGEWEDRIALLDRHQDQLGGVSARDLLIERVQSADPDMDLMQLFYFHCRLLEGGYDNALMELQLARALWSSAAEGDIGRLSKLVGIGSNMLDHRPTSRWIINELLQVELPLAEVSGLFSQSGLLRAPQTGFRDDLIEALSADDGARLLSLFQAGPTYSEVEFALYTIPRLPSVVAVSLFNADLVSWVPAVLDALAEPSALRRLRLCELSGVNVDEVGELLGLLRRVDISLGYMIETNLVPDSSTTPSPYAGPVGAELSRLLAQRWALTSVLDEMAGEAARVRLADPARTLGEREALIYLLPGIRGGVEPVALRATRDGGVEVFLLEQRIFEDLVGGGLLARMMSSGTDTPQTVKEVIALTSEFLAPVLQPDFVDWAKEVVFVAESLMALLPCHVVTTSAGKPLAGDVVVRYGVSGVSAMTAQRGAGRIEGAVVLPQPTDEPDRRIVLAEAEAEVVRLLGYGPARPRTADQLALILAVAPQAHVIDHGEAAAAPAGSRIGPSRLAEITALDLAYIPTDPARRQLTLSSCWGGSPQIVPTPCVPGGMRGAARIAGFDRLVATMWPVREDAAFVFMLLWTFFIGDQDLEEDDAEADALVALWQAQRMMETASGRDLLDAIGGIIDAITAHNPDATALREALGLLRADANYWAPIPFAHPAHWGAFYVCS